MKHEKAKAYNSVLKKYYNYSESQKSKKMKCGPEENHFIDFTVSLLKVFLFKKNRI